MMFKMSEFLEMALFRKNKEPYKDKIYIIGSISQKDKIKSFADYYIGTGRYEVRFVKEEPETPFNVLVGHCFSNILWADRVYVIPKPDGTLGRGVTYEVAFAKVMQKHVDIFRAEMIY